MMLLFINNALVPNGTNAFLNETNKRNVEDTNNSLKEIYHKPTAKVNGNEDMNYKLVNGDNESQSVINKSRENVTKADDRKRFLTNLKPVFLNEHQRKFANPISYLGGPRLPSRNRWSVDSILSLD